MLSDIPEVSPDEYYPQKIYQLEFELGLEVPECFNSYNTLV